MYLFSVIHIQSSEHHLSRLSMLVMIFNVVCCQPPCFISPCFIIVLAGEQKQSSEMSHVFGIHVKWRSYGLVRGQRNQRVRRGGEKMGTVPRNVPGWWAQCSTVSILDLNWLWLWFQISPQLIYTAKACSWISASLNNTLLCWAAGDINFPFFLPKTVSGNRKMMKQSLSFLCEAKSLLKITIWGKVLLQLHLLCTEREKWVRNREVWTETWRLTKGGREEDKRE